MYEGTWTMSPCPRQEVRELAQALGLSETTASVLVRRGYGDPEKAKAFLAAEPPEHDPRLLGNVDEACALIHKTIAAGGRICVHGDYDVDGICATALAVTALRGLGAEVDWHLPSRFEEGYGVSRETLARLAREECALLLTVDCGITAVEEVAEATCCGPRGRRHRSPSARRHASGLPGRRHAALRVPVPGAVRHRRRLQAPRGARGGGARPPPRPRRARHRGRRGAAPRREPRARHGGDAPPGPDGQARAAGAHASGRRRPGRRGHRGDRVPPGAAHQRRRAARPSARSARPAAHRRTRTRPVGSRASSRS